MANESIAILRRAIRKVRRGHKPRGRRYPASLRERIVRLALGEQSGRGSSLRATAGTLGLPYKTLCLWVRERPRGFRAVRLVPEATEPPPRPALVLVTAQGHRIEHLDREDLAYLLRSLS